MLPKWHFIGHANQFDVEELILRFLFTTSTLDAESRSMLAGTTMSLDLKAKHSCMPRAINYYFNCRLFDTMADFRRRQFHLQSTHLHVRPTLFSGVLMARVEHNNHVYRRKYDWHSLRDDISTWPSAIRTKDGRCIVDYMGSNGKMHVEAANLTAGKLSLARTRGATVLPETQFSIDGYVHRSTLREKGFYFNIFHYSQIKDPI